MRTLTIAVAVVALCAAAPALAAKKRHAPGADGSDFQSVRAMTDSAEPAAIACLRSGCQPVPRGCLRAPERSFSGDPSGFDRIICPAR